MEIPHYLEHSDIAVSLSDPEQTDNPLIWVNDAFETLTGYSRDECLGKNCRFLQGPMTRQTDVRAISTSLVNHRVTRTELLNYRANGQPFHNSVIVGPIHNESRRVHQFFGLQWDVTMSERRAGRRPDTSYGPSEFQQRLNTRQSLSDQLREAIVKRSSLLTNDSAHYTTVERLVSIVRPEQFPLAGDMAGETSVKSMLEFLLAPYRDAGPRIELAGVDLLMTPDIAAGLSLIFHVLASGPTLTQRSSVQLQWRQDPDSDTHVTFEWTESTQAHAGQSSEAATNMDALLVADSLKCIQGSIDERSGSEERCLRISVPR